EWLAVRHVLVELRHVRIDVPCFPTKKIGDGPVKLSIAQPVIRPRGLRREAAADLVLALRARLELLQARANAVVDALVVARLEVQAVEIGDAAPVPAIQRVGAAEADRR